MHNKIKPLCMAGWKECMELKQTTEQTLYGYGDKHDENGKRQLNSITEHPLAQWSILVNTRFVPFTSRTQTLNMLVSLKST